MCGSLVWKLFFIEPDSGLTRCQPDRVSRKDLRDLKAAETESTKTERENNHFSLQLCRASCFSWLKWMNFELGKPGNLMQSWWWFCSRLCLDDGGDDDDKSRPSQIHLLQMSRAMKAKIWNNISICLPSLAFIIHLNRRWRELWTLDWTNPDWMQTGSMASRDCDDNQKNKLNIISLYFLRLVRPSRRKWASLSSCSIRIQIID